MKEHQSTVVVSQSWNEIHQVNDAIRAGLKRERLMGDVDTVVTTFQPVDLTDAQKRDGRSYDADSVLVFNCAVRGLSQEAFAERLGVSLRTVKNWEHGRNMPSKGVWRRVCLSVSELGRM